jgi:hypothetical protein
MPRLSPLVAALAAVSLACSDGAGPPVPSRLEVVAGDAQVGAPGDVLAESLAVRVLDERGAPVPGTPVGWGVVSGDARLAPATSTTDAQGIARTSVQLGTVLGITVINAAVAGLSPASFAVETLDPCAVFTPVTLGSPTSGTLEPPDCAFSDGSLVDFFSLSLGGARGVTVAMTSTAVNAFLLLLSERFLALASDDDAGGGTNASIRALLPAGEYVVGATSQAPGETGPYTLDFLDTGLELGACEVVWAARELIDVQQSLSATACPTPDGLAQAADHLAVVLLRGDTLTAEMNAPGFVARVKLFDQFLEEFGSVTAAAAGQTASLVYPVSRSGLYFVQFGSETGASSGTYGFSLR